MTCELKPFIAVQRVRLPPGKGRAGQPEASLAGAAATSLLKRRQQVPKPRISLEMVLLLEPSLSFERGQYRRDR